MTSAAGPAGLALALLTAGLAQAGERPVPAATAARPCPGYGPGFVELPGTVTCIRLSGRISAEAGTGTRRISRDDVVGLGTSARIAADTRTETGYGTLRGYVRLRAGGRE